MENTFTAPTDTIGSAVIGRIAYTIREDGLKKTGSRLAKAAFLGAFIITLIAPQLTLGYLYSLGTWKSYAIAKVIICTLSFYHFHRVKKLWHWMRQKKNRKDPDGNQHTYYGIPIEQMADYLIENQSFQREHSINHFGISRKRQFTIADELEKNGVLIRGESNSRALQPVLTREQLVRQLRDDFPLVWSTDIREWVDRKGPFEQWNLRREHTERKELMQHERLERKVDRLQRRREDLEESLQRAPGFFTREVCTV